MPARRGRADRADVPSRSRVAKILHRQATLSETSTIRLEFHYCVHGHLYCQSTGHRQPCIVTIEHLQARKRGYHKDRPHFLLNLDKCWRQPPQHISKALPTCEALVKGIRPDVGSMLSHLCRVKPIAGAPVLRIQRGTSPPSAEAFSEFQATLMRAAEDSDACGLLSNGIKVGSHRFYECAPLQTQGLLGKLDFRGRRPLLPLHPPCVCGHVGMRKTHQPHRSRTHVESHEVRQHCRGGPAPDVVRHNMGGEVQELDVRDAYYFTTQRHLLLIHGLEYLLVVRDTAEEILQCLLSRHARIVGGLAQLQCEVGFHHRRIVAGALHENHAGAWAGPELFRHHAAPCPRGVCRIEHGDAVLSLAQPSDHSLQHLQSNGVATSSGSS
mmetsp:Transcript_105220/g.307595  ORF Transcript_105220/g.307595 Transcript_105220/m.307595 type:complete len:383 (+) Transcript_105220:466-1614(+)